MTANSPDQFVVLSLQPPIPRVSAQNYLTPQGQEGTSQRFLMRWGGGGIWYDVLMPNHLGLKIVDLKRTVVHMVFTLSLSHEKCVVVSVVCTTVNVDEASDSELLTIDRDHQEIRRD